ncbi:domain-containing protein 1, partial [Leptodontidium sp. MPI-SDFR-AT-0119]
LCFDLEGIRLGRLGSISLLLLCVAPKLTYIIDIHILGNDAFSTTNSTGISLKTILENPKIPKVFFNIRNDSDALYSQYHICVDGIINVQVLELATRNSSKDFVAGLARCIEKDSTASGVTKQIWQHTKESVSQLYDPRKGDRYDMFNERPLKTKIVQYCKQDVELLPTLWEVYSRRLRVPSNGFWRSMVREATQERIKLSRSIHYNGQAKTKICGPWDLDNIKNSREDWNNDVMMWGVNAGMILDQDDNWVNTTQKQVLKSSVFKLVAVF